MTIDRSTEPSTPHRVTVTRAPRGWEVEREHGDGVVQRATYTDWHRVERALALHRLDPPASAADDSPAIDAD